MDLSKFRASGDLSDIVIVVEGNENHLHRFPLFARSSFFESLARHNGCGEPQTPALKGNSERVELSDFPGGQAVFSQVADFCYNMALDVGRHNVVQLRSAAQKLRMFGPGNLADIADKCLVDTVTSCKLSRAPQPLVMLLMECVKVGELAAEAGIVDVLIDALVDTWFKTPSKLSPTTSTPPALGSAFAPLKPLAASPGVTSAGAELLDEASLQRLCGLPQDWLVRLLSQARERGVRLSPLADLAMRYVYKTFVDKDVEQSSNAEDTLSAKDNREERSRGKEDSSSNLEGDVAGKDSAQVSTGVGGLRISEPHTELEHILDAVLMVLPEEAYNVQSVSMECLTTVLRVASTRGCSCRRLLVQLAADKLQQLNASDLCLVSPSMLHDVVLEAREEHGHVQRACTLVDTYLSEMARKGVLTADTFRLLATAVPSDARRCHDKLYDILEYVLKNEDDVSSEQRHQLVSIVNFDLLTEDTLQRALDSQLVPPELLAGASLRLCARLRSELQSVKYIAEMQEEELQKYQSAATPQASPRVAPVVPSTNSDSGFSDSRDSVKLTPDSTSGLMRGSHSVLTSARTKLAMQLHSPSSGPSSQSHPHSYPSSSLLHPHTSHMTTEHDFSLQDELDFKFDRSFRSLDPRARSRPLGTYSSYNSSSSYHHHQPHYRSTYFPYSPKY